MKMMGIDILEHTERQLSIEEARELYASMFEEVLLRQLALFLSSVADFLVRDVHCVSKKRQWRSTL